MTEIPSSDKSTNLCKPTPCRDFFTATALAAGASGVQRTECDTFSAMSPTVSSEGTVRRGLPVAESFIKLEAPSTNPANACRSYDDTNLPQGARMAPEEPLQIQCGDNAALLYVSKLCQGSKGPCILFQNEWLTPNELQYISGRETAKDWKRSIRYKGKSLKSLIARGLIRVHPPICDCLGCRISSPVNRGRLADKCGLPPSSPRKRKEQTRSTSLWTDGDHQHGSRFFFAADIKQAIDRRLLVSNGGDRHESTSSSSESSDLSNDDGVFYQAAAKRPRSVASPTMERPAHASLKRRSSDSANLPQGHEQPHFERNGGTFFDDGVHSDRSSQKDLPTRDALDNDQREDSTNRPGKNTSAFRTVLRDGSPAMNSQAEPGREALASGSRNDALQRDAFARGFKERGANPAHPFFQPHFSQCLSATGALLHAGQNSPRLIADPYMLASHASKMYHRAGLQPLQQGYMHYGLVAPVPPNLAPSAMLNDSDARAARTNSPSRDASPNEGTRNLSRDDARRKCEGKVYSDNRTLPAADRESDQESTTQKSRASSPNSSDNPNSVMAVRHALYKRVPRLPVDLDENVLVWSTEDVCHFVSAVTKSLEIAQVFRDEKIDGHSLLLMREEHLLDRMALKLGPALKILAQVNKLVESTEMDKDKLLE